MVLPHHDADRLGCVGEGSKESECSKNAPRGLTVSVHRAVDRTETASV